MRSAITFASSMSPNSGFIEKIVCFRRGWQRAKPQTFCTWSCSPSPRQETRTRPRSSATWGCGWCLTARKRWFGRHPGAHCTTCASVSSTRSTRFACRERSQSGWCWKLKIFLADATFLLFTNSFTNPSYLVCSMAFQFKKNLLLSNVKIFWVFYALFN